MSNFDLAMAYGLIRTISPALRRLRTSGTLLVSKYVITVSTAFARSKKLKTL